MSGTPAKSPPAVAGSKMGTHLTAVQAIKLELLSRLCAEVLIPPAVWDEVTVQGEGLPGAQAIRQAQWLTVQVHGFPDALHLYYSPSIATPCSTHPRFRLSYFFIVSSKFALLLLKKLRPQFKKSLKPIPFIC